jgi:hypothetical protein
MTGSWGEIVTPSFGVRGRVRLMVASVALWITIATASILDGARRYGW